MGERKSSSKKKSSRKKRLKVSSKAFHCSSGRAYLFNKVVNITFGQSEERTMLPGTHTVTDIFCCRCGQILGWKYVIPLIPSSLSICTNTRAKTYNHGNTHKKFLLLSFGGYESVRKPMRKARSTKKGNLSLKESGLLMVNLILNSTLILVQAQVMMKIQCKLWELSAPICRYLYLVDLAEE
ncbi:uncharacterized protein LOC125875479 isoform X5 [Solanum stenotomum]|uniref:uncharacterized protein LOC125875479 isoform X5 n=1 Tax=Solanum stenotomum TaxID=172797 RepID=UPI0020D16F4D|nr:uncharacterized protein LOC125875479 isoform X5 [Solanum stenotomum]